jgi:hypothetical protein
MRRIAQWIGLAAFSLAVEACIVTDTTPVNYGYGNYGYGYAGPSAPTVGEPTASYVSGMPPEPLYEQMGVAPGDGYVWIDGYWHWNGVEWVWVGGRWEEQQDGYVYVEPYYNYVDGAYVYTPGYWRDSRNVPAGWVVHPGGNGDRRPPVVRPPTTYHPPRPTGGVVSHPPPVARPGTGYRPAGGENLPEPPIYHRPVNRPPEDGPRGGVTEPEPPTTVNRPVSPEGGPRGGATEPMPPREEQPVVISRPPPPPPSHVPTAPPPTHTAPPPPPAEPPAHAPPPAHTAPPPSHSGGATHH